MKVKECIEKANELLKPMDEEYLIDSKIIMEHILKTNRAGLILKYNDELSAKDYKKYMKFVSKRMTNMPLAYILKQKEFMNLNFYVNKGVLIPRDDTEVLVRTAIDSIDKIKEHVDILDLCTGSGCIAISLAKSLTDAKVLGIDISRKTLKIAKKNKRRLIKGNKVKFIKSDLFKKIQKVKYFNSFDMIVSNPPYIKSNIIDDLSSDVKDFEPRLALDGGEEGLDFYKKIISNAKRFLKDEGIIIFEIDYTYGKQLSDILKENGFIDIRIVKDINEKDRVIVAKNSV